MVFLVFKCFLVNVLNFVINIILCVNVDIDIYNRKIIRSGKVFNIIIYIFCIKKYCIK